MSPTPQPAALQVSNLVKRYGERAAVAGLSGLSGFASRAVPDPLDREALPAQADL